MKNSHVSVLQMLEKQTTGYLDDNKEENAPTTESIACASSVSRTVASRELNQLFKQQKIIKINTRPVHFLMINKDIKRFLRLEYDDLENFIQDFKAQKSNKQLQKIIGWNRSLKRQVEQIKASLMYPENGLPTIIFGESGTGKSFFVKCAYEYSVAVEVLDKNAPFVTINCAQYADNPELLSSILFGYVKGAFTGAEEEKEGMLLKANNGILFLDEVHRLSAEGQEKLFTYMDTGKFSPVGDDARKICSSARLMFATTVSENDFLETFLRRVPIRINMPSLEQRSFFEKKQLINNFITLESKRVKKTIEVTHKALTILYKHVYPANVGEIKNLIKSIIATAYSNQLNNDVLKISTRNLPIPFYEDIERNMSNKVSFPTKSRFFGEDNPSEEISDTESPIVMKIQQAWKYIEKMDKQKIRSHTKYVFIVKNLMNHLYFSVVKSDDMMFAHTINEIQNLLKLMQYGEDIYENNSFVYDMAVYIYYILSVDLNQIMKFEITSELKQLFLKQYQFIKQIQPILEKELEITLTDNDIFWMAMMVYSEDLPTLSTTVIIMAHGYATASSIADTGNEILHYPIFHGIDMLPTATAEDMVHSLQVMIQKLRPATGIVIMIDMGSLSTIAERVTHLVSCPMLLIDKVSTPLVLEVGNKIQQGNNLEKIGKSIGETRVSCTFLNTKEELKNVIISTCMTGVGTAEQIQKLLTKSFEGIIDVDIITCEFDELQRGLPVNGNENYNVLGVIGVDDPGLPDTPYLGLEDIISGSKMQELKNMLNPVGTIEAIQIAEQQLIKNFSLTRVMDSLTIISPEKVMPVLEKFIFKIKEEMHIEISNKKQIALYVHLGSMIERLVRGSGIILFKGNNELIVQDSIFSVLKKNIGIIETPFLIEISDPEIAYIREIIAN
jgi:sigma-54 dependent transcriptional regulator of gfr operon